MDEQSPLFPSGIHAVELCGLPGVGKTTALKALPTGSFVGQRMFEGGLCGGCPASISRILFYTLAVSSLIARSPRSAIMGSFQARQAMYWLQKDLLIARRLTPEPPMLVRSEGFVQHYAHAFVWGGEKASSLCSGIEEDLFRGNLLLSLQAPLSVVQERLQSRGFPESWRWEKVTGDVMSLLERYSEALQEASAVFKRFGGRVFEVNAEGSSEEVRRRLLSRLKGGANV